MKFIAILALVGLVASQSGSDLTKCAQTCVNKFTTGDGIGGCNSLDVPCICKNKNFLDGIACCLADTCPPADQEAAVAYAKVICTSVNVQVPDQVVCSNSSTVQTTSSTPNAAWPAKTAGPIAAVGGLVAALALL